MCVVGVLDVTSNKVTLTHTLVEFNITLHTHRMEKI